MYYLIELAIYFLVFVAAMAAIIHAFCWYFWAPLPPETKKCEIVNKKMVSGVPYVILKILGNDETIEHEVERDFFEQVSVGYLYTITFQKIRIIDIPVNVVLSKY